MKIKNKLSPSLLSFKMLLLLGTIMFVGCSSEDDEVEPDLATADKSYTITVGVFILNGTTYEDQNVDLSFDTQEACQSWSRTSQADDHSSSSHDHYNAAKNTTYDASTETITWAEYGPELDQASIDLTCDNGVNGATKTANKSDYSADKNFFLKIKSVEEK